MVVYGSEGSPICCLLKTYKKVCFKYIKTIMSKHKMKSFERKADIMHKSFNITIYCCDTFKILI